MSENFHYANEITAIPYIRSPSVNKEAMPWNSSIDDIELDLSFYDDKGPYYNFSNVFQPVKGVSVFVHSPDEFITQSSRRLYHQNYSNIVLYVTPEIILIADELKSWPIKKRNCYLPGEKNLEYFKIYTKNSCEQECLSMVAQKTCGCVPFYLIRTIFRIKWLW